MKRLLFALLALLMLTGCGPEVPENPNVPLPSVPEPAEPLPEPSQPGVYGGALIDMVLILEGQPVYRQRTAVRTGNKTGYTYTLHDMNGDPVTPPEAGATPAPQPDRTLEGTSLTVEAPDGTKRTVDVQVPLGEEAGGFALAWAGEDLILARPDSSKVRVWRYLDGKWESLAHEALTMAPSCPERMTCCWRPTARAGFCPAWGPPPSWPAIWKPASSACTGSNERKKTRSAERVF